MSQNSFDGLDWINFKASGLDFVETKSKTGRFIGVSIAFHSALFLLTSLIVIPVLEPKKFETVSFDLMEAGSAPATTSVVDSDNQKTASPVAVAPPIVKTKPAIKSSTLGLSEKSKPAKAVAKVLAAPVAEVSVPQSLEDIAAPQLDEEAISSAPIGVIDDKDFSEEIMAINATGKKQIALAQKQLADQASEVENETNKSLGAATVANKMEMESLGLAAAALRAKNQKNSLHHPVESRGSGQGYGNGLVSGRGQGVGQGSIGTVVIRPIQDLRQLPGNPRPEYSAEERLNGNQGRATFLAYVSKAGRLTEFKLAQSTGYRNLDLKTLTALKQWKFYPGQEGWVEIPIQWDLRGGVQEKPTLLRRTNI